MPFAILLFYEIGKHVAGDLLQALLQKMPEQTGRANHRDALRVEKCTSPTTKGGLVNSRSVQDRSVFDSFRLQDLSSSSIPIAATRARAMAARPGTGRCSKQLERTTSRPEMGNRPSTSKYCGT